MSGTTLQSEYAELVALTQQLLKQEFSSRSSLWVEKESREAFAPWIGKPAQPKPTPKPNSPSPAPVKPAVAPKAVSRPAQRKRPPPPPPAEKPKKAAAPISRERAETIEAVDCSESAALLAKIAPHLRLHPAPPSDEVARRRKEEWKLHAATPTLALLVADDEPLPLFQQMALALNRPEKPARALTLSKIDKEQGIEALLAEQKLEWVLATEEAIQGHPELLPLQSTDANGELLGEKRLFILPSTKSLTADPGHKRSLWQRMKRELLA